MPRVREHPNACSRSTGSANVEPVAPGPFRPLEKDVKLAKTCADFREILAGIALPVAASRLDPTGRASSLASMPETGTSLGPSASSNPSENLAAEPSGGAPASTMASGGPLGGGVSFLSPSQLSALFLRAACLSDRNLDADDRAHVAGVRADARVEMAGHHHRSGLDSDVSLRRLGRDARRPLAETHVALADSKRLAGPGPSSRRPGVSRASPNPRRC